MGQIRPLFTVSHKDKQVEAHPVVTKEGKKLNVSALVEAISKAIMPAAKDILSNNSLGEMTLATTIALEALHRVGHGSVADDILSSQSVMFHTAILCSIGMEIGRRLPEEIEVGTEFSEEATCIWEPAQDNT